MFTSALGRSLRLTLLMGMLLALAVLGLTAAERATGPAPATSTPVFELTHHDNGQGKSQDGKAKTPPPACSKSNGKAAQKNPNCQISDG